MNLLLRVPKAGKKAVESALEELRADGRVPVEFSLVEVREEQRDPTDASLAASKTECRHGLFEELQPIAVDLQIKTWSGDSHYV